MVALVNNQPRLLSLKDILSEFLKHRVEVIRRRTQFFLDKAEQLSLIHISEPTRPY